MELGCTRPNQSGCLNLKFQDIHRALAPITQRHLPNTGNKMQLEFLESPRSSWNLSEKVFMREGRAFRCPAAREARVHGAKESTCRMGQSLGLGSLRAQPAAKADVVGQAEGENGDVMGCTSRAYKAYKLIAAISHHNALHIFCNTAACTLLQRHRGHSKSFVNKATDHHVHR